MAGTNFFTAKDSIVEVALTDAKDNATFAKGATVPSAVAGYATGCIFLKTDTGHIYQNEGTETSCSFTDVSAITTAEIADDAVTSAKVDAGVMKTAIINLTAAQINALYTTSIEVIPAVASKAIILDDMVLDLTGTATQFAGGGVVNLQYDSTANGAGTTLHADIAATVITGATARTITQRIAKDLTSTAVTAIVGKGVFIGAKSAVFTTGTGTARVIARYHTI